MPLIYDKGFSTEAAEPSNIIGIHDSKIKKIILNQLSDNDGFIDTTWAKPNSELDAFIETCKKDNKRVFVYSGPDWDNQYGEPGRENRYGFLHNKLSECNTIYIGNTLGKYYFSFWVDFVYENLDEFTQFNTYDIKIPMKYYMCLNRKPHRHRIELVNQLREHDLMNFGHVSLGGDHIIKLSKDIKNKQGDMAVGGDVGITNDITTLGHQDNWNNHFLNVVSETTTYTNVFLTEKTLKPIIGRRPFIILGDTNIYHLLKEWGFDTFDDLFGTCNYTDHHKRIDWIVSNLTDLINKGDAHLPELLENLKPRLEHNYQTFLKVAETNRKNIQNLLDN